MLRMSDHQVGQFATSLSAKLAARSRHVCLFLGAGASRAAGLPDLYGLQSLIRSSLEGNSRTFFEQQISKRNLEQVLSRLRRIYSLLDEGDERVDGMSAEEARKLDLAVCSAIVSALSIAEVCLDPASNLAAWAAHADYELPIEIFTVNYDTLLESALEELSIAYFDGFIGALRAKFRTELVEARAGEEVWLPRFFVRLWKLHGSVNWTWTTSGHEVVRLGAGLSDGNVAAIYPSDAKYDESRRLPFLVLQDRFRQALNMPETMLLISGYSFGDQHLNELVFDAARHHPRSEFVVFCYGDIPEVLVERALTTPNLQALGDSEAILGGLRSNWAGPDTEVPDLWDRSKFLLGDFGHLARYLSRSSSSLKEVEYRLDDARGDESHLRD